MSPTPGGVVGAGRPAQARADWMDVLRGVALIAVVLFHAGTLLRFADLQVPEGLRAVNGAAAPLRIPLLVLLSGLLMPRSVSKGVRRYARGKLAAVGYPFLLWTVLYGLVYWPGLGVEALAWLVPSLLTGGSYLWYLLFLLVFYAAALVVRHLPRLPVAAVFLVLAELAPDATKHLERPAFLFALFLGGWWLAEHPGLLRTAVRSPLAAVAAAAVLGASYALLDMSRYGPRALPGTLAGALVLAFCAHRVARSGLLRPLRFTGRNSVVFYVVHFPVIYVLMRCADLAGVEGPVLLVVVSAGAALAAGAVLALARPRSGLVRGLFTAPGRWSASGAPVAAGAVGGPPRTSP
ncbi:acyltransferase family protein [Kineococcus arenarius]|uniref:acyltransferase family protein n=1 Tax=unclassified Kineococcus TaxID=2621656 RepID=UPI003D7EB2C6